MLTENEVVDHVKAWLESNGYRIDSFRKDTARGDDIAATHTDGSRIFIECKGSISKHGNESDAWQKSAMAVFGAIKETEQIRPTNQHGIAIPDTAEYRKILEPLDSFFMRQKISLFWVQANGNVSPAGVSILSLQVGES